MAQSPAHGINSSGNTVIKHYFLLQSCLGKYHQDRERENGDKDRKRYKGDRQNFEIGTLTKLML